MILEIKGFANLDKQRFGMKWCIFGQDENSHRYQILARDRDVDDDDVNFSKCY